MTTTKVTPAMMNKAGQSIFGPRTMTDEQIIARCAEIDAAAPAPMTEAESLAMLQKKVADGCFKGVSNA